MKKMLIICAVFVLLGAAMACHSGSASATAQSVDSSIKAAADTIKAEGDTVIGRIDTEARALYDSVKPRVKGWVDTVKKEIKK